MATWSANRLDVFVRGAGQTMLHRAYNRAKWYPAEDLRPAIMAGQEPWLERQTDSTSSYARRRPALPEGLEWRVDGLVPLGGLLTSRRAEASWAPNRLDVFVRAATTRFTATHGRLAVITCSSTSNCSPSSVARCFIAWTQSLAASACTSSGCPSSSALAGPMCSQSTADC